MVTPDALSLAIGKVVDAANVQRGRERTLPLRDALNGVVALDGHDEKEKRSAVATALGKVTSPSGAGLIAVWLGAGAEGGADPFPQTQPLLDCLLRFTHHVNTDDEDFTEGEIDDELAVGLECLGQGTPASLGPRCTRLPRRFI